MNYILFDHSREQLLPLTFTRPVCDLRIGILTIREKWNRLLESETSTLTENYLSVKFPCEPTDDNILINGGVCPSIELLEKVKALESGERLVKNGKLLAVRIVGEVSKDSLVSVDGTEFSGEILSVEHPWDIFRKMERR